MDTSTLVYFLAIAIPLYVCYNRWMNPIYRIPAIGYSWPLLSYISAFRYFIHAREMLQEGYQKYKGSAFRVPMLDRWAVVVCGSDMNEELRMLPDDQMSFLHAIDDLVQPKYTVAADILHHPLLFSVIRGPLTRNMGAVLPNMLDELHVALQEFIPTKGDEWVSVVGFETMQQAICRSSNRIFVGLPMCRDQAYCDLAINFTRDVAMGRFVMGFTPGVFKPLIGSMLPWPHRAHKRFAELMQSHVEDRLRQFDQYGKDWPGKPNDLLTWLVEEGAAKGRDVDFLLKTLLSTNFVAINNTSMSMTHALFNLAAYPESIGPLREEIEAAVKTDGWSKDAVAKMWKVDSFMRETQRMNGVAGISVIRKALKEVTLSDGTTIPAGTLVGAAAEGTHFDDANYEDPYVFKPFRFAELRGGESERLKHQYVSTSADYVSFGHGKHACPGRFFVAIELKAVLAAIVLNYDVKLENGTRPENRWIASSVFPDPKAKVMFRRRTVQA